MTDHSRRQPELTKILISKISLSRRDFFTLAWKILLGLSGMLGMGGLWRYFSYQPYPNPPTRFDLGPVQDLPSDAFIAVPEAQAVLINTSEGLQALSMICPHLGCVVVITEDDFACPCHGSRFNLDGTLKRGPADQPLRILHLELSEGGRLILDTAES